MPRYFFNVRHRPGPAGLAEDHEGDELVDVAAAREHALTEARAMIAWDQLATIRDWLICSFEITDEAGQLVLTVPFSDTVADPETEDGG
ncbi:MAG: hypothetical protein MIN69_15110 [Methylorubrum extorquens]|jgi:hypothetical protein|uniref:DUF6894 family protein n=1 Tax=Methylorubrum extorquens TaxID=408 RepID=UPI002FEE618D